MKTLTLTGAALLLTSTVVSAAGIERASNSYGILLADGNQIELSYSSAQPEVSGDYPAALGGGSTGDMAEDYANFGIALKYGLTECSASCFASFARPTRTMTQKL